MVNDSISPGANLHKMGFSSTQAVYIRQQEAVSSLGLLALSTKSPKTVMEEAVQRLQDVLEVEYTKVLELLPGGEHVLLRAGRGWNENIVVDESTVDTGKNSQAGYTLLSKEPVIVEDLRTESRFSGPDLLIAHNVVSGMSCIIWGKERQPYGVLGIHTIHKRQFTQHEVNFLQSVANILAAAVQRDQDEKQLQEAHDKLTLAMDCASIGTFRINLDTGTAELDQQSREFFNFKSSHELNYASFLRRIDKADRKIIATIFKNLKKRQKEFETEFRIITDDKSVRWIASKGKAIVNNAGELVLNGALLDVTERKQADQELKEQEHHLNQIFEGLPVAFYTCDAQGRLQVFNKAAEELWGRKPVLKKDLWCGSWKIYYPNNGRPMPLESCPMAITLKEGRPVRGMEIIVEKPNGERVNVLPYPQPIYNSSGDLIGAMNILVDITPLKKTEEELKRSQDQYRLVVENSTDLISVMDPQGNLLYTSPSWERISGFTAEETDGMSAFELIHPEDIPVATAGMARALEGDHVSVYHFRMKHKDGHWISMEGSGSAVKDEQGNPMMVIATSRDITEKKKAEEELRFHATITQNIADAVIGTDNNFRIKSWNSGAEKLYGWSAEEAIGKDAGTLIPTKFTPEKEEWHHSIKHKGYWNGEAIQATKEGRKIPVLSSIAKVTDTSGEPIGMVAVNRDITDRITAERQKDDFIGIASHELKTPITTIKAYSQLLQARTDAARDEQGTEMLSKMNRQIDSLTQLVEDLLDITKLGSGKLEFRHEVFDFSEMVNRILGEMQLTCENHTFILEQNDPITTYGDKERLAQVVTNLLTNAVKYSPKADKVIVRSTKNTKSEISFSVQDFGIGISEEHKVKVFNRFYRISGSAADTYSGLGLGLFISSEIIKKHNGQIGVESEVGHGSIFYFTLPIVQQPAQT